MNEAEIDRAAAADRGPPPSPATHDRNGHAVAKPATPPPWRWGPELVDRILERAKDPWISLTLAGEELARARAGATIAVIGNSGSGKTSLVLTILVEHAIHVGPAILLSIELPDEEAGARVVGQKCDASWEDALRGRVPEADMRRVLALPRLCVLERRRATVANLDLAVDECRRRWPDQPILVAIDYAQLLDSKEREVRMRVADAFAQIDDSAREKRFVAIALSQMSVAAGEKARSGNALGLDGADLGAETAAIKRFASLTLTLGLQVERADGSFAVELSIGKARMSKGDRVLPMTYWGRSGLWRVAGDARAAAEVRDQRAAERNDKAERALEAALLGVAMQAGGPLTKTQLGELAGGGKGTRVGAAIARLLKDDKLVQVMKKARGAKKNDWMLWTPDLAAREGLATVPYIVSTDPQPELFE